MPSVRKLEIEIEELEGTINHLKYKLRTPWIKDNPLEEGWLRRHLELQEMILKETIKTLKAIK